MKLDLCCFNTLRDNKKSNKGNVNKNNMFIQQEIKRTQRNLISTSLYILLSNCG